MITNDQQGQKNTCHCSTHDIGDRIMNTLGIVIDTVIVEEDQHGIFIKLPEFTNCDIYRIDEDQKDIKLCCILEGIGLFDEEIQDYRQSGDKPAAGKMQHLVKSHIGIPVKSTADETCEIGKHR